ncbi:MAG: hypothetical protein GXP25_24465 [Planctomycetes bacterium]|nr:hypothetical protein [Planctomycetota bacterium]
MKKRLAIAVICVFAAGCGKSDSKPTSAAAGGQGAAEVPAVTLIKTAPKIVIEAEAATKLVPPMKVCADAQASGARYAEAPEGPNHKELSKGGSATYEFEVAEPGKYVLWIRKNWCCGCGNSLTVSVDGAKDLMFGGDATYGKWDWQRVTDPAKPGTPLTYNFAKGKHTLTIGNREDGSKFDQILFIQDNEYVPVTAEKP